MPVRGDVFGQSKGIYVTPAAAEFFLGLTMRKTSRCNLAIDIIFVPSSQSTFNFSVLRGTLVFFVAF